MKATLVFNLPEEESDHYLSVNGLGYYCVVTELDDWLRNLAKYEDKTTITIEEVRDKITEVLDDHDLKRFV